MMEMTGTRKKSDAVLLQEIGDWGGGGGGGVMLWLCAKKWVVSRDKILRPPALFLKLSTLQY